MSNSIDQQLPDDPAALLELATPDERTTIASLERVSVEIHGNAELERVLTRLRLSVAARDRLAALPPGTVRCELRIRQRELGAVAS